MSNKMIDKEIDQWFAEWKANRQREQDDLRRRVHAALSAGKVVIETNGHFVTRWPENKTFIPECMTADYLTDHLMSRHIGFGWDLTIEE